MESIQLYLNSNIADKYFDNNIANAEYILPLIEIPDGFHISPPLHPEGDGSLCTGVVLPKAT